MGGWILSALRRIALSLLSGGAHAVLALSLFALALMSALADPSFYVDRMRNARVYELALDRAAAPAVERALEDAGAGAADADRVVAAMRRALPPRWVYGQMESQLAGPVGYLAGDRDGFVFRLRLTDRIPAIIAETRALAVDADAQAILLDGILSEPLADAAEQLRSYGLDLDEARLKESAKAILDEEWLDARLGEIVDEVGPYIAGETDSFEIVVSLDEPLAAAESEVALIVAEVDWYDTALDGFVSQYVDESLRDVDRTLGGFTVNREDVLEIIRSSVTRESAEPVIADAATQLTRYFLGGSDAVSVSVDLTEAKRLASPQIGDFAKRAVDARTLTIADCASASESLLTLNFAGARMPYCVPTEEPARSEVRARLRTARDEAGAAFVERVIGPLPDEMTFTQNDLREQLRLNAGESALEMIDAVRAAAKDGFRYTDKDLESDLLRLYGPSAPAQLRDAREFMQTGLSFDQRDMREALGSEATDLPRRWLPVARLAAFGGIALSAVLAMLFGLIRGDTARKRIIWASGAFATAGALVWVEFGPLYAYLIESRAESAIMEAARSSLPREAVEYVSPREIANVALDAMSDIAGRAALMGAACAAVGGTVAVAALLLKPRAPRARRR